MKRHSHTAVQQPYGMVFGQGVGFGWICRNATANIHPTINESIGIHRFSWLSCKSGWFKFDRRFFYWWPLCPASPLAKQSLKRRLARLLKRYDPCFLVACRPTQFFHTRQHGTAQTARQMRAPFAPVQTCFAQGCLLAV